MISVIIPVYNMEKYVEQSINSMRFQTFKNIEIIVVNDGSTDSSADIIASIARKDKRIRVINKENDGLASAYNAGQRVANGKYIYFLDSDDWVEPDCLEVMLKAGEETKAEVVKAHGFYSERNGGILERVLVPFYKCNQLIENMLYIPEMVSRHVSQWTCLYRRDFLINNDIWCPEFPKNMSPDSDFMYHVWCKCKKLFVVPRSFVHYRVDNDNSVKNSGAKMSFRLMRGHLAARATMVKLFLPNEFWYVKTCTEFEHFIYELITGRCANNRWDYIKAISKIFKENLQHKLVDFKAWSLKQKITYKTIAYLPVLYWLNSSLKIYAEMLDRRTGTLTFVVLGGLLKWREKQDVRETFLFGRLIKKTILEKVYNYAGQ